MPIRISELTDAGALAGNEYVELARPSPTVKITAATISAAAADNSLNDSGSGFVAAGFAVGQSVRVQGFTGNVANNVFSARITALSPGKLTIGGTDGDVLVNDAAGESVTVTKWETRRALLPGGAAPAVNGGWNPVDKSAGISLAGTNNVQASRVSGSFDAVRAVKGRSTGKFYFEMATSSDYNSGAAAGLYASLANAAASLTAQYVFGTPGGQWVSWRGNRQCGNSISGPVADTTAPGWAGANGVLWMGMACDLDARTVTMQDVVGTRNTLSYAAGGGAMYPLISMDSNIASPVYVALRLLSTEFSGAIPSGYAEWGS